MLCYGLGDGFVGRGRTGRSGGKSLPCRGAAGCGGHGSASGGVPASGTGCAPINALGGWGRSISRCLFRRSRSFTPGNIATTHRKTVSRITPAGIPALVAAMGCIMPSFRGTQWRWRGGSAHSDGELIPLVKYWLGGNLLPLRRVWNAGRLDGADTFQGVTGTHPDQSPTPYPIPQPLIIRLPCQSCLENNCNIDL
jgi:hypothetical protein